MVAPRTHLSVAVNAVIARNEEVLLTRRSPIIREPGKWCLPGGHVEAGETWEESMCREVLEEVGLTVTRSSLLGVYSDPKATVTEHPVLIGGQPTHIHFVVAVFVVEGFSGAVTPNEEVDGWGWFARGRAPNPMIRSHPIRLEDFWAGARGVVR